MIHSLFWIYFAEKFFFLLFSNLALILALCTISSRNPVYSIIALMGVFVCGSALMILVGAEFLGLVYLMVYVGALAVLFLFVIMMLDVKSQPVRNNYNSNVFFLALTPVVIVTFMLYFPSFKEWLRVAWTFYYTAFPPKRLFLDLDQLFSEMSDWFHFENASRADLIENSQIKMAYFFWDETSPSPYLGEIFIKFPSSSDEFYRTYYTYIKTRGYFGIPTNQIGYPSSNIEAIGFVLYLKYFIAFIASGLVLFVAMLGAILLTKYNYPVKNKTQQVSFQISAENTVIKKRIPFF